MTEPNQPIASIARKLAAELLKAAGHTNAHDEPQNPIKRALEQELVEAFQEELREAVTVRF